MEKSKTYAEMLTYILREEHGYSLPDIAVKFKVSANSVGRWKKGGTIRSLSHRLGIERLYGVVRKKNKGKKANG